MTTYIFKELQNAQSECEGVVIQADTLTNAKRAATNKRCFIGTVLKLEYENGVTAAMKEDRQWKDG